MLVNIHRIARERSAILLAALHLTHNPSMDMKLILGALTLHAPAAVGIPLPSCHALTLSQICMGGNKDKGDKNLMQVIFALLYYTIIDEDCQPMAWQPHDEQVRAITGVRLSRYITVVALTLFDEYAPEAATRAKPTAPISPKGLVSAWQVLNLQCLPDRKATPDAFETGREVLDGRDTFFTVVLIELQDAINLFWGIHKAISRLITPLNDFMFQESLRDERLFDDASFVWTKQYFWSLHLLPQINKAISEMINTVLGLPKMRILDLPSLPIDSREIMLSPAPGNNQYISDELFRVKEEL